MWKAPALDRRVAEAGISALRYPGELRAVWEILLTVFGGVIGAIAAYLLGWKDRAEARKLVTAQERIAELEEENSKWEFLMRFAPRFHIIGVPPEKQFIQLEAEQEFQVVEMHYLTGDGARVAQQSVGVSGKSVKVEIVDSKIGEVQRLGSNPKDGSASIQFRLRLRLGDKEKDQTIKAFIKPDFVQKLGGSTYVVRKIIG